MPFVVATLLYFFATDPRDVISRVDWGTIPFFAAMCIAMKAVRDGGASYQPHCRATKAQPPTSWQ